MKLNSVKTSFVFVLVNSVGLSCVPYFHIEVFAVRLFLALPVWSVRVVAACPVCGDVAEFVQQFLLSWPVPHVWAFLFFVYMYISSVSWYIYGSAVLCYFGCISKYV